MVDPAKSFGYSPQSGDRWLTYQDLTDGIVLQYPTSWTKEFLDSSKGGLVRFAIPSANENESIIESVDLNYVGLPQNTTIEQFSRANVRSYMTGLQNFTILHFGTSSLSGSEARYLHFSASSDGSMYEAYSTWAIFGYRALLITYYAEPSHYSEDLSAAMKMMQSVKVDRNAFGLPEAGGTYSIPSLGFTFRFPSGWTSIANGPDSKVLFKGSPIFNENLDNPERVILFGLRLEKSNLPQLFETSPDNDLQCGPTTTAATVTMNGTKALKIDLGCENGMTIKRTTSYVVASQGYAIVVGFGASSDLLYNRYIGDFNNSVKALTVQNATDLGRIDALCRVFDLATETMRVKVDNTGYSVRIASDSRISNFSLLENQRELSWNVDDTNQTTEGQTIIEMPVSIGKPEQVLVDGKAQPFNATLVLDSTSNRTLEIVEHGRGNHYVSLVGFEVVREFDNIGALNVIAGIAVLTSLISLSLSHRNRTKR